MVSTKEVALKGLRVHLVRGKYASPDGGVSETHDTFLLVGPGVPERHASRGEPVLILDPRSGWDHPCLTPYARAEATDPRKTIGPMFSGSYVVSSGNYNEWREVSPGGLPIPLHDRWETPEDYERLSR